MTPATLAALALALVALLPWLEAAGLILLALGAISSALLPGWWIQRRRPRPVHSGSAQDVYDVPGLDLPRARSWADIKRAGTRAARAARGGAR